MKKLRKNEGNKNREEPRKRGRDGKGIGKGGRG